MADGLMPGFGKKLSEVQAEQNAQAASQEPEKNEPVVTEPAKVGEPAKAEPTKGDEPPKTEVKTELPKNEWLGELNKHFKTEYKSPDEFGKILERSKKVDEYEPKLSEYEKSVKSYQQQIADLQSSLNPLTYFSSQEAYVAEQLRKQHPDLNPLILQEVVTTDNKRMDDLAVLIKQTMLETPNIIGGEKGAEEYILEKYGIDSTVPKEEWSMSARNKILIEANATRKKWDELKSQVKLPEVATPEQREALKTQAVEEKKKLLAPQRDALTKFDKFTVEIEDGKTLDYIVPDEEKEIQSDMFDAYFINGGADVTPEALEEFKELREGLMLRRNIKQIYKVIEGDVEAREKAKRDELLNNTNPTNTKSATEIVDDSTKLSNEQGFGKMLGRKK